MLTLLNRGLVWMLSGLRNLFVGAFGMLLGLANAKTHHLSGFWSVVAAFAGALVLLLICDFADWCVAVLTDEQEDE